MPKSKEKQPRIWGIFVGTFSPFHAGQAKVVKKFAPHCDKIIIFVAGLKEQVETPFSYDLRKQIIKESLGPLSYKTKIMPALTKKKGRLLQTGYIPSLLDRSEAAQDVDGIFIFTGADRYKDFKEQMDEVKGKKWSHVRVINGGLGLNDFGSKVDASAIRGALLANDTSFIKSYMAPLISDNPSAFKAIYQKMKQEIETTVDAQQFEKIVQKPKKKQ